jgi:hypothetical protein
VFYSLRSKRRQTWARYFIGSSGGDSSVLWHNSQEHCSSMTCAGSKSQGFRSLARVPRWGPQWPAQA